jgi:crossover junction endodeoxyribonuclease RuvC
MGYEKSYIGIDLSSKTGFISLDEAGNIKKACEIKSDNLGVRRMIDIINQITDKIKRHDVITIENFSFSSKGRAVDFQFGLGHGLRMELYRADTKYHLVAPAQLKLFSGAKGNANKIAVGVNVSKRWGFEPINNNDNITDAYVLAQISRALDGKSKLTQAQQKIIDNIKELKVND